MKEVLSQNEVKFAYVDICESVGALKKYLKIRDTSEEHAAARETHAAGIPTMIIDDQIIIVTGPEHVKELIEEYHLTDAKAE